MPQHVFFSWQSDTASKTGRNLVQRALERAIEMLQADAEIEPAARDLLPDRDTSGVPGSPPLVETIFGKIDGATAFLSDLTYVAARSDGRRMPNPNVLLEHGWALRSLSWRGVISVMNVAHGHPDEHPLPFDLQHFRRPIFFDCPEDAELPVRQSARDELAAQLASALRAILSDEALRAQRQPARPAEAHPSDIELLDRFHRLIPTALQRFLHTHSFGVPFRRENLTAIYTLVEDWIGARFEFHDPAVQAAFAGVRAAAEAFGDLTAQHLHPMGNTPDLCTPKSGRDLSHGLQDRTREAIRAMDAASAELAAAIDAFDRIARDRIRPTSSHAPDPARQRDDLVARATAVLTELTQDRMTGQLPGIVRQPSMTLRALPLSALEGRRLDAGQVARAQLLFPPSPDARVETDADGRQWWSFEPPLHVGLPNRETRWRTRLVRPGAIEYEAMIGVRIDDDPEIAVDGRQLELEIVHGFERLGAALSEVGLDGAALITISFDGVEDVMLIRPRGGGRKIQRRFLSLPLQVVDSLAAPLGNDLHDVFDMLWQASGWPDGSPSFGSGGWEGHGAPK